MIDKIFGEKKSIKRYLIKKYLIIFFLGVVLSIIAFFVFVNDTANLKLIEIKPQSEQDVMELLGIIRRSLVIMIIFAFAVSFGIMNIIGKRILKPIQNLTDATKRVASGDFNVELETTREDEVGVLTENFNQMVKDLKSTQLLQKDFIDNVSHELKTPISSIQGFAVLLEDKNLSDDERKEYTNIIIEESNRLLNLATNILKLSKLENQSKIQNSDSINISEQIRKEIAVLEPKWKEKNIKFNVSMDEAFFVGDEDLILQVWMNILDNAIKFSKENSEINVSVRKSEKDIVVKIQDHGRGMTKEEKSRIFEKFYQIDKSHSETGSGLGLAIVKRIIDLSNGKIDVESKKNVGTTFTITLPINEKSNTIIIV